MQDREERYIDFYNKVNDEIVRKDIADSLMKICSVWLDREEAAQYSVILSAALLIFKYRLERAYGNSITACSAFGLSAISHDSTAVFKSNMDEFNYQMSVCYKVASKIEEQKNEDLKVPNTILAYAYIVVPTIVIFWGLTYLFEYLQNTENKKHNNSTDSTPN